MGSIVSHNNTEVITFETLNYLNKLMHSNNYVVHNCVRERTSRVPIHIDCK